MVRVADNDQYTKQPVLWNNLPASTHEVLERFVTARLLISGGDKNKRTLEVAHEALFRVWPRMADCLRDNKAFLVWQQRLNVTKKNWEESRQPVGLLLGGLPLREAEEWLKQKPQSFSPAEREFVTASQNRRTQERVVAAIGAGLVLWLVSGVTWLWQKGYDLHHATLKIQSLVISNHVLPQMVEIPGGTFQQGDVEKLGDAWRNPVRSVAIKTFSMGQYEITFEEYDRFAIATGRRLPEDEGWGRGRRPVINVSWDDASAYAAWLTQQIGKRYRLPSESEWEYAARSGAKQEVWAGTSDGSHLVEYTVFFDNSGTKTAFVGTKQSNQLGLHDMSGNVWEWVQDCLHLTYDGAPQDNLAWLEMRGGDCSRRVIRGGSWYNLSMDQRTSHRKWDIAGNRSNNIGFRLVQDLEP